LVKGPIDPEQPVLVRMHALDLVGDMFGERSGRGGLLAGAMRQIGEHGSGVVVVINRNAPGSLSRALRSRAGEAVEPDTEALRDYGVGAQILAALGVHEMILLTNTHHTPVALAGYGLSIVEERPIPMEAK
jgi:3,4-dihydroxy 2-butanone 4-phosphate synthase/GTP cyclohydrolase II